MGVTDRAIAPTTDDLLADAEATVSRGRTTERRGESAYPSSTASGRAPVSSTTIRLAR